jgi:CDP-paratose 2-epimerase
VAKQVVVTGGAGFIGSHVAEHFAKKGDRVRVVDNLSREVLLGKSDANTRFNWDFLETLDGVELVRGDVRDEALVREMTADADVIVHAAAQTAVTTSVTNPGPDFSTNLIGTFNVLEGARASGRKPAIVYCSTNKVYGENVNAIGIEEEATRYRFEDRYAAGIPETFSIDNCEHTPYGCSKLCGDLYMQDYAHLYGLRTGVFRMSCIYGTRQFGVEDQGWVAWFTIAALTGRDVTIFGDGKQVRDLLWVDDVVAAYDAFLESDLHHGVFNLGGGAPFTLSLLELLDALEKNTGRRLDPAFSEWRPSDQRVYISDIARVTKALDWAPKVSPEEGVRRLAEWVSTHAAHFGA